MRKNGDCSGLKKSEAKFKWKSRGLKPEHFEHAWSEYKKSTCCDWCAKDYKSNFDKQMDHCHNTGDFRNILCKDCNGWRRDNTKFISHCFSKRNNKWYYYVQIQRNKKRLLMKSFHTEKEADAVLLKFKKENWWYFPFEDFWN